MYTLSTALPVARRVAGEQQGRRDGGAGAGWAATGVKRGGGAAGSARGTVRANHACQHGQCLEACLMLARPKGRRPSATFLGRRRTKNARWPASVWRARHTAHPAVRTHATPTPPPPAHTWPCRVSADGCQRVAEEGCDRLLRRRGRQATHVDTACVPRRLLADGSAAGAAPHRPWSSCSGRRYGVWGHGRAHSIRWLRAPPQARLSSGVHAPHHPLLSTPALTVRRRRGHHGLKRRRRQRKCRRCSQIRLRPRQNRRRRRHTGLHPGGQRIKQCRPPSAAVRLHRRRLRSAAGAACDAVAAAAAFAAGVAVVAAPAPVPVAKAAPVAIPEVAPATASAVPAPAARGRDIVREGHPGRRWCVNRAVQAAGFPAAA